ncbi:hypothetical protein E3V36_05540 [Candidatus Marinimicrobia bacterium MT.SAG.2]|nr:hypothetical protein E3V36_05540 [Candidatus Marinimicrobia bacterium MT.SAG.2]
MIGLSTIFIGLLAGLGNLLAWFEHPERMEIVNLILTKGSVPSSTAGFLDLYSSFPPTNNFNENIIVRLGVGSSMSSGGYFTPVGPLKYFAANDIYSQSILTFEELKQWATGSSYPWLAWAISAIGFFVTGIGIVIDIRQKNLNIVDSK